MKKIQATIFSDNAPTATETIANGYALGQWWQINGTGKKYYHKTDGVWVLDRMDKNHCRNSINYNI